VASRRAPFKRHITAAGGATVIASADTGTIAGITAIGVIIVMGTITAGVIGIGATGIGVGVMQSPTPTSMTTRIDATTTTIRILHMFGRPIAAALFRPAATASACAGGNEIRRIAKTKRRSHAPALLF
jgi:hypothetical protein